jgi:hypothetical protein
MTNIKNKVSDLHMIKIGVAATPSDCEKNTKKSFDFGYLLDSDLTYLLVLLFVGRLV